MRKKNIEVLIYELITFSHHSFFPIVSFLLCFQFSSGDCSVCMRVNFASDDVFLWQADNTKQSTTMKHLLLVLITWSIRVQRNSFPAHVCIDINLAMFWEIECTWMCLTWARFAQLYLHNKRKNHWKCIEYWQQLECGTASFVLSIAINIWLSHKTMRINFDANVFSISIENVVLFANISWHNIEY